MILFVTLSILGTCLAFTMLYQNRTKRAKGNDQSQNRKHGKSQKKGTNDAGEKSNNNNRERLTVFERCWNKPESQLRTMAIFLLNLNPHRSYTCKIELCEPSYINGQLITDRSIDIWFGTSHELIISPQKQSAKFSAKQGINTIHLNPEKIKWIKQNSTKPNFNIRGWNQVQQTQLNTAKSKLANSLETNPAFSLNRSSDLNKLTQHNQSQIQQIGHEYTLALVQLNNHLKQREMNLRAIIHALQKTKTTTEFDDGFLLLQNDLHLYNLVFLASLNMTTALLEGDMVSYFHIHQVLDALQIFNTTWEKEIANRLSTLEEGITELMYSIKDVGDQMTKAIRDSIEYSEISNQRIERHLKTINSELASNNFIGLVQTYQLHKIKQRL